MHRLFAITVITVLLTAGLACDELLEKGSISGNVSDDSNPVNGAFVMLLEEGELLAGGDGLSNGNVTGANGNYKILLVEPNKNYYVCAVDDTNGNLEFDPGTDRIGYYGSYEGFQWVPTSVSVSSGQNLTGINIRDMI
ncbi:MAG: carboxypeptidase regulatory-like domain-containing protein [bacterium]|nr:carboxypeptidase regulatory-like domain-containing protein [bacterium]